MKNNKGISLITLLITVIVMIIIVSMVTYNGINLINDAKQKDAQDRLKVICSAILKDDTFLEFSGDNEITLDKSDFDYMDILKYYDDEEEIKITKNITYENGVRNISYTLLLKDIDSQEEYSYTFDYNLQADKYNYNVSFNEAKGVNRPILLSGMTALMPDGVTEVLDIYTDDWYDYSEGMASFAKMKYQDKIYVWIPRFAYDIQNFYEGREATKVPNTAIGIVFLRENTSYMPNDEVMQGDYKVHPAFTKDGVEYSGIWVEYSPTAPKGEMPSLPLYDSTNSECNLHMMTNIECGAALYLMYALNDTDEIIFESDEYVAACIDGVGVFNRSNGFVTAYTSDESGDIILNGIYGDAFLETPWDRVLDDYPTAGKKYVIRKFDSSLFDFTNSNGTDEATYRGVITIK